MYGSWLVNNVSWLGISRLLLRIKLRATILWYDRRLLVMAQCCCTWQIRMRYASERENDQMSEWVGERLTRDLVSSCESVLAYSQLQTRVTHNWTPATCMRRRMSHSQPRPFFLSDNTRHWHGNRPVLQYWWLWIMTWTRYDISGTSQ